MLRERTLRMEASVAFSGYSAEQVFEIMGDPARITDWYLLAKSVRVEDAAAADQPFIVDFTLFGEVIEQVLFWDPPRSYIYIAKGEDFPILDYHAEIAVEERGTDSGLLFWRVYFDRVSGLHHPESIASYPSACDRGQHTAAEPNDRWHAVFVGE